MINKGKLASALLGLGNGGGLQKLTIRYEEKKARLYSGQIEALFNPSELSYARTVNWEQKQLVLGSYESAYAWQEFLSSEPETLSMDLTFDTYESHSDKLSLGHLKAAVLPANSLLAKPEATDVSVHTVRLAELASVNQELHRPPICKLEWGEFEVFTGVLTSLSHTFTMFMPNGMPVRAKVSCAFVEFVSASFAAKRRELHSADVAKTRTVRRGETLQSIAAEEYDDPTRWREIARANGIVNPRALVPGMQLKIPRLR
jgi:Contractile injection system tube protein/LysM domain